MRPIDADMLVPDRDYYDNSPDSGYDAVSCSQIDAAPTLRAIPIPEGATNGDVLKAIFPDMQINQDYFLDLEAKYVTISGKILSATTGNNELVLLCKSNYWGAEYTEKQDLLYCEIVAQPN